MEEIYSFIKKEWKEILVFIILFVSFVYGVALSNNAKWIEDCNLKCSSGSWTARYQLWNTEQVDSTHAVFNSTNVNILSYPTIAQYWCTCDNCSDIDHPYGNSGFWYNQLMRFCE